MRGAILVPQESFDDHWAELARAVIRNAVELARKKDIPSILWLAPDIETARQISEDIRAQVVGETDG